MNLHLRDRLVEELKKFTEQYRTEQGRFVFGRDAVLEFAKLGKNGWRDFGMDAATASNLSETIFVKGPSYLRELLDKSKFFDCPVRVDNEINGITMESL